MDEIIRMAVVFNKAYDGFSKNVKFSWKNRKKKQTNKNGKKQSERGKANLCICIYIQTYMYKYLTKYFIIYMFSMKFTYTHKNLSK